MRSTRRRLRLNQRLEERQLLYSILASPGRITSKRTFPDPDTTARWLVSNNGGSRRAISRTWKKRVSSLEDRPDGGTRSGTVTSPSVPRISTMRAASAGVFGTRISKSMVVGALQPPVTVVVLAKAVANSVIFRCGRTRSNEPLRTSITAALSERCGVLSTVGCMVWAASGTPCRARWMSARISAAD